MKKYFRQGDSLAIQWLGVHTVTAEDPGSIPGGGIKNSTSQEWWSKKKKKSEQRFPLKNKTKPLKEGVQAVFFFAFYFFSIHSEFSLWTCDAFIYLI